ncbi:MAG: 6-phosphogluconolactonase [Legionellaceae bacterium]|nr:6-phosphogluconolactonase [Legionellaceae bacterium]
MRKPHILSATSHKNWVVLAAETIQNRIFQVIEEQGFCHMMLTGGQTVIPLYQHLASTCALPLDKIHFWFGDERCVSPDHPESNYSLVKNTLFSDDLERYAVERIQAEKPDREAAAKAYEALLPARIDILLLGMGEDGHIASLFPHSSALSVTHRRIVPTIGSKLPFERMTITPGVILSAKTLFLLVTGAEKGKTLARSLRGEETCDTLPVCLTLHGTWLLDRDAAAQIEG